MYWSFWTRLYYTISAILFGCPWRLGRRGPRTAGRSIVSGARREAGNDVGSSLVEMPTRHLPTSVQDVPTDGTVQPLNIQPGGDSLQLPVAAHPLHNRRTNYLPTLLTYCNRQAESARENIHFWIFAVRPLGILKTLSTFWFESSTHFMSTKLFLIWNC